MECLWCCCRGVEDLECRDEGGPCGGVGGAEEGREECSEGRGRSVMMCGGDGGNVVLKKCVLKS